MQKENIDDLCGDFLWDRPGSDASRQLLLLTSRDSTACHAQLQGRLENLKSQ